MGRDLGCQVPIGQTAKEPQNWKAALEVGVLFWQVFYTYHIFEQNQQSLFFIIGQ